MTPFRPLLLSAALMLAYPVSAQTATPAPSSATSSATGPAANASNDPTEITVTARRINERLQDVPLSIRALTGRDLEERGITSLSDLSLFTPGLSYSPDFGRTAERPVIRGISALRQEAPQPVSVFIDGVYVRDAALGLAIDDARRVEVIKGPQSALYGRSTYAGAINYITLKPGDKVEGRISATIATAGESTIFGAISVPLLKDLLSMRVRVRKYEYGGQYTNELSGNKIGQEDTLASGVQFAFTPSPNFDAHFALDRSSDRDGIFAATVRTIPTQAGGVITSQNGSSNAANGAVCNGRTVNIVGNNAAGLPDASVPPSATNRLNGWPCGAATFTGTTVRRNEADLANYTDPVSGINYGNIAGLDRDITRAALTLNYRFDNGMILTGQTANTQQQSNIGADQSYSAVRFTPAFLGGTSWLSYNRDRLKYQSHELRLSSALDQRLTWLVGGFVYKERADGLTANGVIARTPTGGAVPAPLGLTPTSASSVDNFAPFARVQYDISSVLRISAEGRYSEEKVKVGGTALGTAIVTAGTCVTGQVCFVNGERVFKSFDPRITVDFKPAPGFLVYAQVASGNKSGGFNTTPGLPVANFAYDGEDVKSAELGLKSRWANGKLLFNLALFRNDISGLQLSNLSTVVNPFNGTPSTTTIVNNVGKARTQGFETELVLRALPWLTLSGNYAFTDAKAQEGTEITNGTVFGGNRSVAGFTLPRSPKHSAAGSVAVELPLGQGLQGFGRVDVVYQSRRYAEIQNMVWADAFTRVNASLGLRHGSLKGTFWVKNAGNDNTSLNGFRYLDPNTFRRTAVDFLPRLRQYGVTVAYEF